MTVLEPLLLNKKELPLKREAKYLGVVLDTKLSWNSHLENTITQPKTTFVMTRRLNDLRWGNIQPNVYWVYTKIIRPSTTYGSLVWWPKVFQATPKPRIGEVQRL